MGDTPEKKGRGKGKSKADWLSEIHLIMAKNGLTIKDVEAAFTGEPMPAVMGSGECNPCFEQNAGLLYCDGSGVQVLPFGGSGVPVLLRVTNGVPEFVNHSPYLNTVPDNPGGPVDPERAPAPRENGGPEEPPM